MIEVRQTGEDDPMRFAVTVGEGGDRSRHEVTMSRGHHERLTGGGHPPEATIDAVFRFLLDREPKEAIMGSFDVGVVSRYFPEFEDRLGDYLGRA